MQPLMLESRSTYIYYFKEKETSGVGIFIDIKRIIS